MLLYRILPDRELWSALRGQEPLTASLVEEGLRTDGPAQAIWRTAKQDVTLGGVAISAGSRLSLVLSSANMDGAVFDSPQAFDPSRSNVTQHVAFGRGIHTCVGAGVGRMEAQIALDVLAFRLPELRLADDAGYSVRPSAIQRMASSLAVIWD
jgi:cytochrome P450